MRYLCLPHIMNYKRQCVVHNYTKKIENVLDHICAVSLVILYTDWKVCSIGITIMCTICLDAILYGCVSPHLSATQCRCALFVNMFICCTCVSCYWYKTDAKCRYAMPYMCASPCRHGRPNIYAIYSLCSYRCVSPCWPGAKCIYNSYYTNNTCYICVIHEHYKSCVKRFVSHTRCASPCCCVTSHGYSQTRRSP